MTFRIRGHEEASGTKYVPKEMIEYWEKRDPILNYESFLLESDILNKKEIKNLKKQFTSVIEDDIKANLQSKIAASVQKELNDVLHPYENHSIKKIEKLTEMRFVDSISNALELSMKKYDDLIIMGQDIAEYGGVFKVTDGFSKIFGKDRVRNTPICESSIIETAMGLSICGRKSIVELQFSDFISSGFNPVVNYLAKTYYRWKQKADVVLRMPCGAGVGAGPFHSQTNEAWFTKNLGL